MLVTGLQGLLRGGENLKGVGTPYGDHVPLWRREALLEAGLQRALLDLCQKDYPWLDDLLFLMGVLVFHVEGFKVLQESKAVDVLADILDLPVPEEGLADGGAQDPGPPHGHLQLHRPRCCALQLIRRHATRLGRSVPTMQHPRPPLHGFRPST
eukprot:jgi/Botrbrau1/22461/Bobra.0091s0063.1